MDPKTAIIFSDMDGTLLTDWNLGPVMPERNRRAVSKWLQEGGGFSVATGRNLKNVPQFFEGLTLSIPLVLVNGALLYKMNQHQVLETTQITQPFIEECLAYQKNHDFVTMVISDKQEVYRILHPRYLDKPPTDFPALPISEQNALSIEVLKVSLIVREDDVKKVRCDLMSFPSIRDVNILQSSPRFIEMVSSACTKEGGIRRVLEYQKTEGKTIIAIGDYLNDMEMLTMADIAACPENSIDDVKKIATIITCMNNEGAVGDLIERLLAM